MITSLYFSILALAKIMLTTTTYAINLGDSTVYLIEQNNATKQKTKTIIHLHESEQTALRVAQFFVSQQGGHLVSLSQSGQRTIRFTLKNVCYEFDPNRIFTDAGIKKTLADYSTYSLEAHTEVKRLARRILRLLPKDALVAVHNNNQEYSLKAYLSGEPLASDANALNFQENTNPRNFYFVTRRKDYNHLANRHFNVVLQSAKATNDGSLSYLFLKKRYINIEAGYEEDIIQLQMLKEAMSLIHTFRQT